jgi:hypothetical protein
MFARNPNRSAVRAEVLPFSICATTHRKGGGGWLAGCGRHPIQRRSFCDVMRAQCQRHGHGGHGGSLQDRMSLVSAVVSRGQTLDKRPGSGELLAFRPARVGRASFLLACEHGFFHHNDTRVRNNNTASLLCSFSTAVPTIRPDSYGPCVLGMRLLPRHRCPRPSVRRSGSRRADCPHFASRHYMRDNTRQQLGKLDRASFF